MDVKKSSNLLKNCDRTIAIDLCTKLYLGAQIFMNGGRFYKKVLSLKKIWFLLKGNIHIKDTRHIKFSQNGSSSRVKNHIFLTAHRYTQLGKHFGHIFFTRK